MTPERWIRVEAVLDAALDLPQAARAEFVARACGDDAELRAEVERMLLAHAEGDGPLPAEPAAEPAALFAAPVLARTLGGEVRHPDEMAAPAAEPGPARRRVGPWRLLHAAGEGGMGTVWVAERADGAFRMRAALKLVRAGLHFDPQFVRRFQDERDILARLDHPGIARMIDGGITADGVPYYVMEYVDGEHIDRWCDARRTSVDARLALFAAVCDAVAAAHRVGVVHRDLKPSNVLVTPDGRPKLLDFGIAKMLDPWDAGASPLHTGRHTGRHTAGLALTRTGERLLTPEYASPEQLRGEAVTPATDVYSLGVLLYELLTGRRPHEAAGLPRHEVDRAVIEDPAPRPSSIVATGSAAGAAAVRASAAARGLEPGQLRQRLRGDLDALVLMALRKEPGRRYRDAADFAADVRRCIEGRRVHARGDGAGYRARQWLRRHRRLAFAAAAGMLAGAVALGAFVRYPNGIVSEHGLLAARFYDDGMRAYNGGNWSEAVRLLTAAVAEDSTFVLAALYASDAAARDEDYVTRDDYLQRALQLADAAPLRERLVVRASEAFRHRLPTLRAYADSLLALDPADLEAQLADARADFAAGDFIGAVARNRSIVAADSASLLRAAGPCHACQALQDIITAYMFADSLDAAVREAMALTALRPDAASSWRSLAIARQRRGDDDESAFRRVLELDPADADFAAEWVADLRIRQAAFAEADAILRARIQTARARSEERALWTLVTSLRNQGRRDEALVLARRFRTIAQPAGWNATAADAAPASAVLEAQVLLESGRPAAAAALYDSISRYVPPEGGAVSHRIWHLAHRADALAAAGDTTPLSAIADTIRTLAPHSGYGRDALLHHHVHGLLHAARGDHAAAANAFRHAVFSWTHGYTRTNLELGRALLALGRHAEAVAALQPALRGSLEVNNLYVTHARIHEALADAWRAAGRADSAAVHDAWLRRAGLRR